MDNQSIESLKNKNYYFINFFCFNFFYLNNFLNQEIALVLSSSTQVTKTTSRPSGTTLVS